MRTLFILSFALILSISQAQVVTRDSLFNALIRGDNGGWIAGDGTFSIPLPNGNTFWLFGDSFIGTVHPDSSIYGAKMIRNCAIYQQGDLMQAIYRGGMTDTLSFIPTEFPDSIWFWPEQGIVENDTLKLLMAEYIINDGPPGWNYEFRNTYLVYLSYPGFEILEKKLLPYYASNGVMYGTQLMVDGDYTYIYGRKNEPGFITNAHLARVSKGNLIGLWEFYDGDGWSADPASSLLITSQIVSQQYAVFKHQQKFVLLTQETLLGPKIYTMTANLPEGPWDNLTEIYSTPIYSDSMWTYNALAHPQFNDQNALLVSYNTNGAFDSVLHNVEFYRPTFIRVPFVMIDTSFAIGINDQPPPGDYSNLILFQNNPNPVSQQTTIAFDLTHLHNLSALHCITLLGVELTSFINRELNAGHHEI